MSIYPFPLIIQNYSGVNLNQIYVTILGINNLNPSGQQFYNLLSQQWQSSQCSHLLSDLRQENDNPVLEMPYIDSGIVFLSINEPLVFQGISQPNFSTPADNPSFNTLYDKFEISYLKNDGFPYINTTNVDFYCLSLELQETRSDGTLTKAVGFTKSRQEVLQEFSQKLTGNWGKIIQKNGSDILRVVAPNKAVVDLPNLQNNFDASDFQTYVDTVWDFYAQSGNTITVDMTEIVTWNPDYNVLFTGKVIDNQFVFSGVSSNGQSLPQITFEKPTGSDAIKTSIFGCANLFDAPNTTPRSIPAKNLAAAFNVGILAHPNYSGNLNLTPSNSQLAPQGWSQYQSDFYQQTMTSSTGILNCYNVYAGVLHSTSEGGLVYGFAYADVTQSDSTLAEKDAVNAIITIQSL